jgi:predicted HTH domain antitoxin
MDSPHLKTEVKFTLKMLPELPEIHRVEAERKAKEAYVMTLLKQADISSGRAARLLGIPRLEVIDLMSLYDISPFPMQTREELEREVEQLKRSF